PSSGTGAAKTPAPSPSSITVDVYNGSRTPNLAHDVSGALTSRGYKAGAVADASAQSQTVGTTTRVFYGSGASANAQRIASEFGATSASLPSLPVGHVEVLLGSTATTVPAGLASPAGPSGTPAGTSPSAGSPSAAPSASGTLKVSKQAPYGIPCVN
ncbi:MAG TPA: LytR C-terminal domain-containing protein, partial [Trebonia sp.]